ncbi:unnamed protein product [Durusdinium trenchii]
MSRQFQVLVVDFSGHLADISLHSEDLGYVQAKIASEMEMEAVRLAIEAHVPEVIVAEFSSTYSALQAGRVCDEAGVRLACSVRSNVRYLVDAFVHWYTGRPEMRELGCLNFPFPSAVVLSRQSPEWEVLTDAPGTVCGMAAGRLPACDKHQQDK